MATQHYTRQGLDDDVASQIFDEYVNRLDPNRRFFLHSDIVEFGQKQNMIDDYLERGDLSFAFALYERLIQRVKERVEYARERLKAPFDFTIDEDYLMDRSDAPWAESEADLDEIWRRLLKNQVLTYRLMEEQEETGKQDDTDAADDDNIAPQHGEKDGDTARHKHQPDPMKRALTTQERYLHYLEENESIDILELFLTSVTRVFDPHSVYMAPATEEDFDINMSLSLEGIGATLSTEQGYVKIVSIVPGGPADKDGELHEGDRIIAVQQKGEAPVDVIDMPLRKVVQMIRGPKGTEVILTVLEADKGLSAVPVKIDIVRDEVQLTAQEAKAEILSPDFPQVADAQKTAEQTLNGLPANERNGRFMVITLASFYSDFKERRKHNDDYKSASRDVRTLLEEATEKGLDGVVLDLRGNGGGSLEEAIKIAGFFFDEGPVVQVRNAFGKTKIYRDPDESIVYDGPVVVLVDRLSASASEIVAAALKDHHRGVVLGGNSTHGKGTVQHVLELNRFVRNVPAFTNAEVGSLKFTIAKFYRVNGASTQRRGVPPDIEFPSFSDHMDLGEATLDHALAWDQIDPLEVDSEFDVRPYLPTLKECSLARLDNDPEYADLLQAVERFGNLRDRKTLPLNLEARRTLHKEEEKWLEEVREKTIRRRAYGPSEDDEEAADNDSDEDGAGNSDQGDGAAITEINDDLVLEEALRIISDLAWLQRKKLVADPAADTSTSVD